MPLWLIRAGSHGEHEPKFIQERRIYATFANLNLNLRDLHERTELIVAMQRLLPDAKPKSVINWASQIWPFCHEMVKGDWVVVPLKTQHAILIGQIDSDYHFDPKASSLFYHWRAIEWLTDPLPRTHFGQDLLHSFGAFMTICRVQRNNAEGRIRAMHANGWRAEALTQQITNTHTSSLNTAEEAEIKESRDLEEEARDQIARLIEARFKGHNLTRLVEAILKAQGYTTYRSPDGPDGGADILAGAGPFGFGSPRLCVEVKSEANPIDRSTVDKLLGAVSKFGAQEGLFVSWSGFKSKVQRELATSFFRVRLWDQSDLLEALFACYDRLDDDIKAELPLKRIWGVAAPAED